MEKSSQRWGVWLENARLHIVERRTAAPAPVDRPIAPDPRTIPANDVAL